MKKRFLVTVAFMLIVVCGIFLVNKAMAVTCYELKSEDCTTDYLCSGRCTPSCSTGRVSYSVDKCKGVCTGYYQCGSHPTDEVDCFVTYDCTVDTSTCPSDATEKECGFDNNDEITKMSKKYVTGSGCDESS